MKEQLLRKLLKVSLDTVENMLPNLLQTISEVTSCKMCSLWKINRRANFLSVQARKGYDPIPQNRDEFILSTKESLLGYLVTELSESKQPYIEIPSINESQYLEKIKCQEFAKKLGLNRMIMISIPTLPASNPEQTEAILAIYPRDNEVFKNDCTEIVRDYFSLALSR